MTTPTRGLAGMVVRSVVAAVVLQVAGALIGPAGPGLWCSEAAAQGCGGCAGSWKAMKDAEAAHASCPEGREAACYQALLATQNVYTSCINRGCDTGTPQGERKEPAGSDDAGSTADENVPVDGDADGVPDGDDACPGTPPGVAVDSRGCPPKLRVTVDTPRTNAANEVIQFYPPGTKVKVHGTVKDAAGDAIPGAMLTIELVGTGVSTFAGTMVGTAYYEAALDLPLDIENKEYTIRATASTDGYADAEATTTIRVWGPELKFGYFRMPTNIPSGTTTEWEIPVKDDEDQKVKDAYVRLVATHLASGRTLEASGPSRTEWHPSYPANPWFTWKNAWTEEDAGEWKLEVTAQRKGFTAAHMTDTFLVGAHIVELGTKLDDVSCYPWCNPHCRHFIAIVDHDIHNNTPCYIPARCSLGHDLRYEWTADGGTISASTSRGMVWRPPQTPGEYTIRGTAICSEDPTVRASFEEEVEGTTRELFWKSATQGRIEMRGFDRVKVEKITGEFKDADVTGHVGGYPGDYEELEEGRWLEGEEWEVAVGLETTVILGVYRDGKKVGEVEVGEMQFHSVQQLRKSTHGWLPSVHTSPYLIFVNIIPDRRYEAIDFSVSTGTETASVRGTTFFVSFDDGTSSTIGALEGEVAVTPHLVDAPATVVSGGHWTTVDGRGVRPVRPMTPEQVAAIEAAFPRDGGDGPRADDGVTAGGAGDVILSEDFSGDEDEILAGWEFDEDDLWAEVADGVLLLEPYEWGTQLQRGAPLENVCVAFDGWVEKEGFGVVFADGRGHTFSASMGAGTGGAIAFDDGDELVAAAQLQTFDVGAWSRFRICLWNGLAEGWVDGEKLVSVPAPQWLRGAGTFAFSYWGWPVRIDNLEITAYR